MDPCVARENNYDRRFFQEKNAAPVSSGKCPSQRRRANLTADPLEGISSHFHKK